MKHFFFLPALLAASLCCSCQKQSEADRNAEIERQVQERLAAERQTEGQQKLTQAQVDLDQRLKDLENQKNAATATKPVPRTQAESERERHDDSGRPATGSYSTFYTRLEPEGDWRETSDYGYVWQPRVAQESRDWRPYTNGRWVYTDAGWTWISEESFGWATYHYGRWTRLRGIGWVWVPGNEWAPAWVSWRTGNDYVGWAPLPPEARFERDSGIHHWADNYYDIGPDQYVFVSTRQLGDQRVERAIVPINQNVTIINQTTNVTNITYKNTTVVNEGPDFNEMRGRSQQPIERLRLERQTSANFDAANARPVVRGEVLQMEAPIIARAQAVERPRRVKETLARVEVDHGWEQIGDRQAAEKARTKMRSEATPPPNAPSRTFVKPVEAPAPAATVPSAGTPATPTGVKARPSPTATSVSVHTPTPWPAASPVATPRRILSTPSVPPAPSDALAHPAGVTSPPPAGFDRSAEGRKERKAEKQMRRREGLPVQPEQTSPSTASTPANAPATDSGAAPLSRRELRRQERTGGQQAQGPSASATPMGTATPASATASGTSDPSGVSRREQRKLDRRAKRTGAAEGDQSASPSPANPQ